MELIENQDGYGYGYGYGYGSGDGSGDGYGYGYGSGDGDGDGYGYGYGSGDGDGYGYGSGDGSGDGDGYGYGYGDGYGDGYGSGYGSGDGYGDGSGDGYGDGSGDGSGDGYEKETYFKAILAPFQRGGMTVAFWRSSEDGKPANGGNGTKAVEGLVEEIKGPLELCTKRALHGTHHPEKWKGKRWWIVALYDPVQSEDEKLGSLKRKILKDLGKCPF